MLHSISITHYAEIVAYRTEHERSGSPPRHTTQLYGGVPEGPQKHHNNSTSKLLTFKASGDVYYYHHGLRLAHTLPGPLMRQSMTHERFA